MKFYLPFILLLLLGYIVHAQDPVYRNISNLNGLPSNTVYNILQDKLGFIWLAHDKGLCKYDGKTFKAYKGNNRQGRSLSNLLEINNSVWCQDFSGNYFYTQGDSLFAETRFKTPGVYTSAGFINSNLLVSIKSNSIQTFNIKTGAYNSTNYQGTIYTASSYTSKTAQYIYNNQLCSFNGANVAIIGKPFTNKLPPVFFLQQIGTHLLAFTKSTFPYCYQVSSSSATAIPLLKPGLFIQDISVINNELWVSTSSGAYCFDEHLQPKYNNHCFFNGTSITKIMKDREGNYWFTTINKGINLVPNINTLLFTYSNESLTAITTSKKGLLIGTANNRLLQFNTNNTFTTVYKEPSNHEVIHILNDEEQQRTIFCSDKLITTTGNKKIAEEVFAAKSISIINKNLYAVAYASGISLMARTTNGLANIPKWLQFANSTLTATQYKFPQINFRGRSVLYHAPTKTLYAATTGGLFYFNEHGNGKVMQHGKDIYASQLIADGNAIYAATFNDGLLTIYNKTHVITLYKDDTNTTIYKIYKSKNWIWMIGDEQLFKYNIATKQVIKYSTANGLPKAELKDIVVQNGNAYIASTAGLVVLHEDDYQQEKTPPLLTVNGFLVNNKSINWRNKFSLANDENNIIINFSVLAFKGEEVQAVQYKINNGIWQNLEASSRELNLPSLSPGNYNIQLQAVNYNGLPSQPLQFSFSIAVPFYKQLWFVIFIVLAAIAMVYIFFQIRLKNITQKNQLLSQKIQLEQELHQSMLASIKSQMNPHFLYNALNTIQSYIYTNDKENASHYLGKFSQLTRLILEMSNKDIVAISEEIKALQLYLELEQLRFKDKLVFELQIDDAISIETVYIPSMLIQPYIENAVKHGLLHKKNNWILNIHFLKKEGGVFVTIDDNGIGRKRSGELNKNKAKHHQSFASDANKKRLEILNKGLKENIALEIIDKLDTNGNATGTTANLFIPFQMAKPTTYPKFY